jgi:hypothetical protein
MFFPSSVDSFYCTNIICGFISKFSGEKKTYCFGMDIFAHDRVKRGRGAVGSRMDETGPYLPPCPDYEEKLSRSPDAKLLGVFFKPEKYCASSEEELGTERLKKAKKVCSKSLDKKHSRKHRSKEKSRGKKRKRKDEKRSKH